MDPLFLEEITPLQSCQQASQVKYGHSDLLDLVTVMARADLTCLKADFRLLDLVNLIYRGAQRGC